MVEKFESTVHAKAFTIYNFGKLGTSIGRYFSRRSDLDQKIDVCFTNLCQGATETPEKEKYYSKFLCDELKMQQILDYRYLIAVEGNDVATGLKWMLYSNSVVFMPPPRYETRFREGLILPWIHYIPLANDFQDLPEKIKFCDENSNICERIAKEATKFAQKRVLKEEEAYFLSSKLLIEHIDRNKINFVDKVCDRGRNCIE